MSKALVAVNLVWALLFACAAYLQLNDPDPVGWFAIYATAGAISAARAFGLPTRRAALAVFAVAAAWGTWIAPAALRALSSTGPLFERFEMMSPEVEEVREVLGLAITSGWMLLLALVPQRARPASPAVERRDTVAEVDADTVIDAKPLGAGRARITDRNALAPDADTLNDTAADTAIDSMEEVRKRGQRRD